MKNLDLSNKANLIAFCKLHRKRWRYELVFSRTLPKLKKKAPIAHAKARDLVNKYKPAIVAHIVNTARTLEKHYNIPYSQAIDKAELIQRKYGKKINKRIKKHFGYGKPGQRTIKVKPEQALEEQIARGFVNKNSIEFNPDLAFIKSNVGPYVWPIQYQDHRGFNLIYETLSLVGVTGYTGITLPKKYKS